MNAAVRLPWRLNIGGQASLVPTFPVRVGIPRIIHQTFKSPPWPTEIAENVDLLKAMNRGWDYRFYTDDDIRDYIERAYGTAVLRRYDMIDTRYGAARADLFRYLLLYREGGVYLDMKSGASRPLDEVIRSDDTFLLSTWRNERGDNFHNWGLHSELSHLPFGEYQQWFIVAAAGHPFLKRVIEYVLRNIDQYIRGFHGAGAYAVLRVTGPVAYTLAIEPIRTQYAHRVVDSRHDLGFTYSIFDKGSARVHEGLFQHYSSLETPLIHVGPVRSALSALASGGRVGVKWAKARLEGRGV